MVLVSFHHYRRDRVRFPRFAALNVGAYAAACRAPAMAALRGTGSAINECVSARPHTKARTLLSAAAASGDYRPASGKYLADRRRQYPLRFYLAKNGLSSCVIETYAAPRRMFGR